MSTLWPLSTQAKGPNHVIVRTLDSHPNIDIVCHNLHEAYLLEVGLMLILVDHETLFIV